MAIQMNIPALVFLAQYLRHLRCINFNAQIPLKGKSMLLGDTLILTTEKYPYKTAVVNKNRKITYEQLNKNAASLANGLISEGICRQDRIAVYLENSIESVVSIYGILKSNGVFLIINPQVKHKKLSYILNDCQVKILVTDFNGMQLIINEKIECPSLKLILVSDYEIMHDGIMPVTLERFGDLPFPVKIAGFGEFIRAFSDSEPVSQSIDLDLAALAYTSGSTGNPKGVMLTHINMLTAARSITKYLENKPDDIILNYLPLSFDYGLYQVLMSCLFGGTVILEKAFVYPYQAIEKIVEEKVTGFPIVPAMAALILQMNNLSTYDFNSVRYITNTGQALASVHINKIQDVFQKAKIYSMYGLTECKRVSFLNPSEINNRPLSVGKAIPNTEVWLIDETGNIIEKPDTVGELVIRGSHIMKGYWNKPDETGAVLKPGIYPDEKVLLSGDFFKMDRDGYLYFVSRKDDIIKSGGERISPREIEDVLYQIEGVSEAAVIGVADDILGYAPKAFLVFNEGHTISKQEILKHCREHLEQSRVPKYVEFRDFLPKSSNGKIRKKDLEIETFAA